MNLNDARKKINEIDKKMAHLFEERMNAVKIVLEYKKANNLPIFDEKRELEVISNNLLLISDESLKEYYLTFLQNLMDISKKYQGDHYE